MKTEHKPINFEDNRGLIRDIISGEEYDALTFITCTPGALRGNHYHKESIQLLYVISGKLICAAKKENSDIETIEINDGDLVTNEAGERHAFKAITNSVVLCITKGPRKGKNYEADTYRLKDEEKILL